MLACQILSLDMKHHARFIAGMVLFYPKLRNMPALPMLNFHISLDSWYN